MTRWKASEALPAVGGGVDQRVDDLHCSTIEPGHPCVTMSGNAFSCFDRMWRKWMSNPSIVVVNCGTAFSFVSNLLPRDVNPETDARRWGPQRASQRGGAQPEHQRTGADHAAAGHLGADHVGDLCS